MSWFHVGAAETRREVASVGGPMRVLVSERDSEGKLSIVEQRMDGPGGPPLHLHPEMDEWLMVIEGGPLTVQVGDERRELQRGESVWIPHGTPHAFDNRSGAPLRALGATTPGGVEEHRIAAIWGRHGVVVGPPLR